jgi:AAHS family 4-hydroxybenzoate transporter-like MFS transporter
MAPGFAAAGVAVLLLSQITQPAFIVVAAAIGGAGFGLAVPTIASTMMALAGEGGAHAGIIAWFMTMDGLGHAIGPAAAALILAASGAAGVLVLAGAGFIAVATIATAATLIGREEAGPAQDARTAAAVSAAPPIMRPEGQS